MLKAEFMSHQKELIRKKSVISYNLKQFVSLNKATFFFFVEAKGFTFQ